MFKISAKRCVLGVGVGLLFFCSAAYIHQQPSSCPTPLSRLDLLHTVVRGTVNIDAYHANTPDKAEYKGHYYSDKAPGIVVLAFPGFATGVVALRTSAVELDSESGWLFSSWIACVSSIGGIAALGAGLLIAWLLKHTSPRAALVTTLAVFLGAAPLPYATMMFSHALTVGLIAIALWAISKQEDCGVRSAENADGATALTDGRPQGWKSCRWRYVLRSCIPRSRLDILAGFACGWTLASEYTSGIVVAGILAWLVSSVWRRSLSFCLAAAPPLLLIPTYSLLCFGEPFTLPYSLNPCFPEMREGIYAIKWPDPETAFKLMFSPARGLLFWSPFLVMAGAGYWKLAAINRRLFWLTYGVPLLQIFVISGRTWDWQAGPSLGPRYLAPILPLIALPCALGVQRFPKTGVLLAAYSIGITTLATLTNACPPFGDHPNPLLDLHIPMFLRGEFAPNAGMILGLSPFLSVTVFYAILAAGVCWVWRLLPAETSAREAREKIPGGLKQHAH